jgi:hypothetical protein
MCDGRNVQEQKLELVAEVAARSGGLAREARETPVIAHGLTSTKPVK